MFKDRPPARTVPRPSRPTCETLERRTVAAASVTGAVLGQITGRVTDAASGLGIRHIQVELFNSQGKEVRKTFTNADGNYAFPLTQAGPYVVHEVAPRGLRQVTPNFAQSAPIGSYAPGAGNNSWNYVSTNTNPAAGPVGPAFWADIAPAGRDPFESPINLKKNPINLDTVLKVRFNDAVPSAIVDNSHQIQVQYSKPTAGSITAGGIQYNLAQFHYHSPAETTVDGHTYPLEEHFVTTSAGGGESVVTAYFKVGAHNRALDPILNAASASLTTPNSRTTIAGPIHLAGLLPANPMGWFYRGSLTTPPLSQAVNWFIYKTPITLDSAQLGQYESVASQGGFFPNARPVQPLDGRVLNRVDNDVNFTGTDVGGQDFSLAG